ncbi:FAD-binding oxidoreductase [Halalkalibacter kiskunsagensis]|uniref:FAD-binding oxidoreductase n=1 Tax=Halalkalibacter kiskunsagensis TaxID=1548599 RepID=A0ABV6K9A3_9BACI
MPNSDNWLDEMIEAFEAEVVNVRQAYVKRMSQDYYWYSPILKRQLESHFGDCVAAPRTEQELMNVLSFAAKRKIPVVPRGGGTGNYGQIVPLYGGIVLDTSKLNQAIEIKEGEGTFQAGMKLGMIEKTLHESDQELRFFPSTFMKSTLAGFIAGGTGGIGSIEYGTLWDEGNVLELTIVTVEETPRKLKVKKKEELAKYIHSYGLSGVLTEAKITLAKKTNWNDMLIRFADLDQALLFSEKVAINSNIKKRLISVCEAPLSTSFSPIERYTTKEDATVLLQIDPSHQESVTKLASTYKANVEDTFPHYIHINKLRVSDFSWNHVTLWWLKQHTKDTYLQGRFHPDHYLEQVKQLKDRFGDKVLIHFEWIKVKGAVVPSSQPVIRYHSPARLQEIIDAFHEFGIKVSNPHTYLLEEGGKDDWIDQICVAKGENDPYSLLNPGKTKRRANKKQIR